MQTDNPAPSATEPACVLDRPVGRMEPDRAAVGDVVSTNVLEPRPETLRLTLDTQAAADFFNKLPPEARRGWRLEKRIGPVGCQECAWGKVAGCWRCGSR